MDTLPLPPHPAITDYDDRAKGLLAACTSADEGAVRAWASAWLASLAGLQQVPAVPFVQASIDRAVGRIEARMPKHTCTLADARSFVAGAHGFDSWDEFARHIEALEQPGSQIARFERAADAVVGGDLATLRTLLEQMPELTQARSTRVHRATLLHYVAANGVEDFRQKSPPDAPAVARLLLDGGAAVDALAGTYGGGADQTTMNLLVSSVHPAAAGVQAPLVDVLLDHGAASDGVAGDGSPLMTALAFGYIAAAEALAGRGARVDNVIAAAALGRDDLIRAFVAGDGRLAPDVPLAAPPWLQLPDDPGAHLAVALAWACRFGRAGTVALLLDRGVDPAAADRDGQTGLHWASGHGHLPIVDLLLARAAPLEAKNRWGGTVLDSTVYFALHEPAAGVDYLPLIERLIAAGARVDAVTPFPTGNRRIDELLRPQ